MVPHPPPPHSDRYSNKEITWACGKEGRREEALLGIISICMQSQTWSSCTHYLQQGTKTQYLRHSLRTGPHTRSALNQCLLCELINVLKNSHGTPSAAGYHFLFSPSSPCSYLPSLPLSPLEGEAWLFFNTLINLFNKHWLRVYCVSVPLLSTREIWSREQNISVSVLMETILVTFVNAKIKYLVPKEERFIISHSYRGFSP